MAFDSLKICIVYCSVHHKNTEKLIKAIAEKYPEITILDASSVVLKDLQKFDLIGAASGIFFGKMHKTLMEFLENNLPERKKSLIIYTSGANISSYGTDAEKLFERRKCRVLGKFNCPGFDTFGPFGLVGGKNKNHPDEQDVKGVLDFFDSIIK